MREWEKMNGWMFQHSALDGTLWTKLGWIGDQSKHWSIDDGHATWLGSIAAVFLGVILSQFKPMSPWYYQYFFMFLISIFEPCGFGEDDSEYKPRKVYSWLQGFRAKVDIWEVSHIFTHQLRNRYTSGTPNNMIKSYVRLTYLMAIMVIILHCHNLEMTCPTWIGIFFWNIMAKNHNYPWWHIAGDLGVLVGHKEFVELGKWGGGHKDDWPSRDLEIWVKDDEFHPRFLSSWRCCRLLLFCGNAKERFLVNKCRKNCQQMRKHLC